MNTITLHLEDKEVELLLSGCEETRKNITEKVVFLLEHKPKHMLEYPDQEWIQNEFTF